MAQSTPERAGEKPRVLVANRGEIARRVSRSCHQLGLEPVMVFTQPDALSLHVLEASSKVCLGDSSRDYTNADRLVEAALSQRCVAVHPGYGFLSESADFVEAVEKAGIAFLGPTSDTMRKFSRKHTAREFAISASVPVLPGSDLVACEDDAVQAAAATGYPVLLKATGGGGGIGIYICHTKEEVKANFAASVRQGKASFGDAGVFVEKYVQHARHIEIQIFGDGKGNIAALGERECSIQRRHQKVVEESPSPYVVCRFSRPTKKLLSDASGCHGIHSSKQDLWERKAAALQKLALRCWNQGICLDFNLDADPNFRQDLVEAAKRLGVAAKYRSAGTVEFLVDQDTHKFYFLEVNTRLQVEHGITEMISGLDLVNWQLQLQLPGLEAPAIAQHKLTVNGWAIECRINAEDPFRNFTPSSGTLGLVSWPEEIKEPSLGVRVDTWVETGTEVSPFYDSLIAKLMVHGTDRADAISKMQKALDATQLGGMPNNLEYLKAILAAKAFAEGATTTKFLECLHFSPNAIEVVSPGMGTTVQDWPGRVGYWHVGVPPSGPMDSHSFRLANALVGNAEDAAALEISLSGPTLRFHTASSIALCGAEFSAEVDGKAVPFWESLFVPAGAVLSVGGLKGTGGARAYIAVGGGIDVPPYLGSRATFPGGKLGGTQGRPLRVGDQLPLKTLPQASNSCTVPESWRPNFAAGKAVWEVGVLPGPNADPDYFTPEDIAIFYREPYSVHYNSNRLGIRLQGPRPKFARKDGGEGGSHPSNVHDHVYALGTINYTGDMPVVLMFDGPSLGGFVCPATITSSQLWKMGQVSANDTVRFKQLTLEEAFVERMRFDQAVALVRAAALGKRSESPLEAQLEGFKIVVPDMPKTAAVLASIPASSSHPGAQYRLAGDRYVFVEYGPMELDLNLRVRIYELEQHLASQAVEGLLETSPGVRSCMIEYDQRILPLKKLISLLLAAETRLPAAADMELNVRILHLPMAFNESRTNAAVQKYMRSSRAEAPYLPSNVDFVAANNGIAAGAEGVADIVFAASYMVLGLGDVYLGAPCAVPVDPRHRLVVPKYNPARTYTPEGAVGIGGSYMCIYPMESPGGYQLIGQTLPIWNTFGRAGPFSPKKPWLLRNFDQVQFHRVSEEDLVRQRKQFHTGQLSIRIEETTFSMRQYNEMVASVAEEVASLKRTQAACMQEQMRLDEESLQRLKKAEEAKKADVASGRNSAAAKNGTTKEITAAFTANVWEVKCNAGQAVKPGDTLLVLEAMKMEYPILAESSGVVAEVHVESNSLSHQGDLLVSLSVSTNEENQSKRGALSHEE